MLRRGYPQFFCAKTEKYTFVLCPDVRKCPFLSDFRNGVIIGQQISHTVDAGELREPNENDKNRKIAKNERYGGIKTYGNEDILQGDRVKD